MDDHFYVQQFDDPTTDEAKAWVRAAYLGFHEPEFGGLIEERLRRQIGQSGFVASSVWDARSDSVEGALDLPVATLARYQAKANLGNAEVASGMLTWATVRPSHKRRGLLRNLLEMNVYQLAQQGLPLVLLTASDARIYERFGFERVVDALKVQVEPGLELRDSAKERIDEYRIEWIDRGSIERVTTEIYARAHVVTRGSVTRPAEYTAEFFYKEDEEEVDPKYRCFVCVDPNGIATGYVIYEVRSLATSRELLVHDMVFVDGLSQIALWEQLFKMELVSYVAYGNFPADGPGAGSPLFRAVKNSRAIKVVGRSDFLWARILDPKRCLEARSYSPAAMSAGLQVAFQVEDPDSYAAGSYMLQFTSQGPQIVAVSPDLLSGHPTVTVNGLAALVYASSPPSALAEIGLIRDLPEDEVPVWDAVFAATSPARTTIDF